MNKFLKLFLAIFFLVVTEAEAAELRPSCNGTAADTAVIQQAFNNLKSGDTLVLTKMCGVGPTGLTLTSKSNITVKGVGRGSGFIALAIPATNAGMNEFGWGPMLIDVVNCDRCIFRDMDFNLNHRQTGAIVFHDATYLLYENNYHKWGTGSPQGFTGLNVHPATMVAAKMTRSSSGDSVPAFNTFRHNVFEDSCCQSRYVQRGIFYSHGTNVTVEKNIFRRLSHTAIAPMNAAATKVLNNYIFDNRYGSIKSAYLDDSRFKVLSGADTRQIFAGNVAVSNGANGINFANMTNAEAKNNTLADNNNAIAFTGPQASNILAENNVFCGPAGKNDVFYQEGNVRTNVVVRNNQVLDSCSGVSLSPPQGAGNYPVGSQPPGGTTGGSTGTPAVGVCNQYGTGATSPTGYGAAWNPLTSAKELLLDSYCNADGSVRYTVGSNTTNPAQYTYKMGYFYSTSWQPFTLGGRFAQGSTDWLASNGTYTNINAPSTNYFWVSYVCHWTGTAWKCGCRDATCAQPLWQLQGVRR